MQLSECIEILGPWWEEKGKKIDAELTQARLCTERNILNSGFTSIKQKLQEIKKEEKEIFLNLPKSAWYYLIKQGKGRDFLWEVEILYLREKNSNIKEQLKTLIGLIRNFLIDEGNYKADDLGINLCEFMP